jgi:hypothetical protein
MTVSDIKWWSTTCVQHIIKHRLWPIILQAIFIKGYKRPLAQFCSVVGTFYSITPGFLIHAVARIWRPIEYLSMSSRTQVDSDGQPIILLSLKQTSLPLCSQCSQRSHDQAIGCRSLHTNDTFLDCFWAKGQILSFNEMVHGPCAHLQLHERHWLVLYRLNVIIDRLKLLLVQVMLLGVVHNCQHFQ